MEDRYLYRGKRVNDGKWIIGCFSYDGSGNAVIEIINSLGEWEEEWSIDPLTVGQCTGFKDKDGKMVFEGDVVFISDWDRTSEVYWHQGSWLLKFDDNDEFLYENANMLKIIGNIHDNRNS